jgi:tetratricopeptide (TPR) repeat protein
MALQDAKVFFEKAIEFNPRMYKSYWYLHEIEYMQGNIKGAIDWLNKLIKANPDTMHHKFTQDSDSVLDRKGKLYAKLADNK